MSVLKKFDDLKDRLAKKIGLSQTPVPGFIMGLSGTDSIIAFLLLYQTLNALNPGKRVGLLGIHYVKDLRQRSWFEREVIPWLQKMCPFADIRVEVPLGGNQDPQRWADLNLRSLNAVTHLDGRVIITPLEIGHNYWVVNTINATEHELGTYAVASKIASIAPIRSLWKTEILQLCKAFGVPKKAIDYARLPDCLCGRAELAAENIELIDDILRFRLDPTAHDPELLRKLFEFIKSEKDYNGFKIRTPFLI